MKIIDCEQRSAAWFEARLGKPTASSFCEIVTATGTYAMQTNAGTANGSIDDAAKSN